MDYAASTPVDERVLSKMQSYWTEKFANPSGINNRSIQIRKEIEEAREQIARELGARSAEIVFTAGGTEANNLAIFGVSRRHKGKEILATAIEHESVIEPLNYLSKKGWQTNFISVASNGLLDLESLERSITDNTVLISVIHVSNEIGVIQPLPDISRLVSAIRQGRAKRGVETPVYLHTDACQSPATVAVNVDRLGIDIMTLNASKIYGPKQVGCLYIRSGVEIEPIIFGGGQEYGLRSGTENTAGIIGFAKALEIANTERKAEHKRLSILHAKAVKQIQELIPESRINGHLKKRTPSNINVTIPDIDGERAVMMLSEEGIDVATGSACGASKKDKPSHTLLAIGLSEQDANSTLRISMGRFTDESDIDKLANTLKRVVKEIRELG